jgi:flagellar protein FliJ
VSGFRLGGLLRLRRLEEERAAATLARANADRQAARDRRSRAALELSGASFDDGDTASFQAAVAGRASLMGLLEESALLLAMAGARADEAQRDWTERRTDVRALEKLEERHDAAATAEEGRTEQLLSDEVALRGRGGQEA